MHGWGIYTWKDGRRYEGEYEFDKKHGYGIYTWADGIRKYEGFWESGKMHGLGRYLNEEGEIKFGRWEDGKRTAWIEQTDSEY